MKTITFEVPDGTETIAVNIHRHDDTLAEFLALAKKLDAEAAAVGGADINTLGSSRTLTIDYKDGDAEITVFGPALPPVIEDTEVRAAREIAERIEEDKASRKAKAS